MTNDNKVGTNGDAGKGVTLSHWQRVGRQVWNMPFLLYLVKCLLGTVICYGFYVLVPQYHLYWSLVSVLLVLAPDHLDSIKLPLDRIKANLAGGMVGLACFFLPLPPLAALCIGVPVTILVCYLLGFGNAARSALAAIIIVFIQENESGNWQIAMERMGAVVLGCLVALALTLLFHWGELLAARRRSALCSEMDGE
jgi:uncharacterized membrane protein YccC